VTDDAIQRKTGVLAIIVMASHEHRLTDDLTRW
jgi:hypothetical protein